MRNRYLCHCVVSLVIVGLIATSSAPVQAGGTDILDRIRGLAGVVVAVEAETPIPGTRFFLLDFAQPVDHANPTGPTFRQRVTILHRDVSAPTVLQINGYNIVPSPVQYELTSALQANQIHVEHRYFQPSRPDPAAWQFLDIAQSAADHHEIVRAFKAIYAARWVATGFSKGGMASVYFRYFYPDDVDATVAYVTPSSHGRQDERYVAFVASLGSAKCRKKLVAFQRRALKKRDKLVRFMGDVSYEILGKDRALEFAVLEMPFALWQYFGEARCDQIPGKGASPRELFEFLNAISYLPSYGDALLVQVEPYYYQASTQLGGPAVGESGLEDLLRFPGQDSPEVLPPLGVPKSFDPTIMPAVEQFVFERAERVLFIYGANDPWSTNAFEVSAENDAYRLFVTGSNGNHGSQIVDLPSADRSFAFDKLAEWLAVSGARVSDEKLVSDPSYRIDRPTRQELFLR